MLSLLTLHLPLLTTIRFPLTITLGVLVALVLIPVMCHLWLDVRSGNINYVYFQELVWGVFFALLLLEVVTAAVKRQKQERCGSSSDIGSSSNGSNAGGDNVDDGGSVD